MDVRRSINTKMWADDWFENLNPSEKLLWVYLLTNSMTNMLGFYEISLKRISFETGLSLSQVENSLKDFEENRKAFYWSGWIYLPNWLKNQSMNPNMQKAAIAIYENLPNNLIIKLEENGLKGFESLSNAYLTLRKKESEIETEIEMEKPAKKAGDFVDQVINIFQEEYFLSRKMEYVITNEGKERGAAGKLVDIYKKILPVANTKNTLDRLREYFRLCMEVEDKWLYNNMSLPIIISKFNQLNNTIKNGNSNRKSGEPITDAELADILKRVWAK